MHTRWNELTKKASDRQANLRKKLEELQDHRLQKVEDWLTDLEEGEGKLAATGKHLEVISLPEFFMILESAINERFVQLFCDIFQLLS